MKKYSLLYTAFGFMVLLALLHFVASSLYLYWTEWWYDYMMHFLGGFAGGLVAVWFFFYSGLFSRRMPTIRAAFIISLVAVMIAGVAWEVFESAFDIAGSTEGYVADTIHDLIADAVGALAAGWLGVRRIFNTNG